jgi:hypothetical protein
MSIFGLLISIFIGIGLVYKEIEKKITLIPKTKKETYGKRRSLLKKY